MRKTLAYWRGFEAGLEGWPLLGVPGRPERADEARTGYQAGVKIRDALRGVQAVRQPDKRGGRSATWKAGYGAAMRGETLGDLTWQQDRPAERAELEAGYKAGCDKRARGTSAPRKPPKRRPPRMTAPECVDWEFRQKLLAQFARQ